MPIENHAVIPPPLQRKLWTPGASVSEMEALWYSLHKRRSEIIAAEKADPLQYGWEPGIWRIADALLGLKLAPIGWKEKTGLEWEDWCEKTRLQLGFSKPLDLLLISGTNRGSKSEWAAKRTVQLCMMNEKFPAWCFHESEDVSVLQQQNLIYKYLPVELKGSDIRSRSTYVAYKDQTGFAGNHIIFPNGSSIGFRFYKQDLHSHEGANIEWIWPDELIGSDLLETLLSRVATLGGKIAPTFTPVFGWTATVQMILQSAKVTRWTTAFFLPKDGGPPDVPKGLGFHSAAEMLEAHETGRWSIAEECYDWHKGISNQPLPDPGREFVQMPRVMKCQREGWGVLFYCPMDNPYGNPMNVWNLWKQAGTEKIERRIYGFARKSYAAMFPQFDRKVHVIKDEDIPAGGSTVFFLDPTPGGRPFVMVWFRAVKGKMYLIKEWPSMNSTIPGIGVLGAWAVPSGSRNGQNDGKRGPAQDPIGWGFRQYLLEIGRIEGWTQEQMQRVREWKAPVEDLEEDFEEEFTDKAMVVKRQLPPMISNEVTPDNELGAGSKLIRVNQRWIDCRAASSPRIENDRARTMLTDFDEWGMTFELTPGGDIEDKTAKVNDLLSWNKQSPISFFNSPSLFIAESCENSIYAMENWMNVDGQKGACKDFVDPILWACELEVHRM